jgi:hypothetical protein
MTGSPVLFHRTYGTVTQYQQSMAILRQGFGKAPRVKHLQDEGRQSLLA